MCCNHHCELVMTLTPHHSSPAGPIAVLMASALVVLKHETSTYLRQRHNFILIDFKFGVGDYVREVTNPTKFGSGPTNGRAATWGATYGSCDFYF